MPKINRGSHLQLVRPWGRDRNSLLGGGRCSVASIAGVFAGWRIAGSAFCLKLRNIEKLPAALCLALFLISVSVHADDNSLTREANADLTQKDYVSAFSKFSVLAQHGNAIAQFNLGAFYLNGLGVQKDEKLAYHWFATSSVQGNARALQVIQNAAARGNENAKNEMNKIQQQTASPQSQPNGSAQQVAPVVGDDKALWMEANTALTQKDYNAAFQKFSILAQHGNALAQFNLGAFYFNGQGVQRDEKQAFDWFAKSAAQGNARALQVIQSVAAKGNESAKNAYAGLTQSSAAPSSGPDVKTKSNATTTTAHARSEQSNKSSSSDFSLGASLGQTRKIAGINNSLSFGLLAGYKLNTSFGVELAYNSLYRNANASSFISATNPGATATFDLNAISLVGQYTYGLSSKLSLLGDLGFHSSSFKVKSSGNASRTGSASGLVAGLKVQYDLGKNVGLRGGFDTYIERGGITGTLNEVGLAVIYKF